MPTRPRIRVRLLRVMAGLSAVLFGVSVAACSGDDASSQAPRSTSSEAPGSTEEEARSPEVREETLTIEDAQLGQLAFDALTAGQPEAAAEGRLVLLLHGFPESAESYREILPLLAEAGYYAVAPSQRGYSPGARPTEIEAYGILHLVDDVVAQANSLGADTFHLTGHDWGGAVAWVTAAIHPDRVSTLTVLSTPHPDPFSDAIADPNDEQSRASGYMATFRAPGSENQFLANGAEAFITALGVPADKAAAYAEVLDTPEALGAALNWYRATPVPNEARIGAIKVPTLYMWGTEDIAFSRGTAEATASYVEAPYTFEEIPGGSHWLPEEIPSDIATAMLDHIERDGS